MKRAVEHLFDHGGELKRFCNTVAAVDKEKAQKKSTGFGSGLTVKESKAKKRCPDVVSSSASRIQTLSMPSEQRDKCPCKVVPFSYKAKKNHPAMAARSSSSKTPEELPATFGIGKGRGPWIFGAQRSTCVV